MQPVLKQNEEHGKGSQRIKLRHVISYITCIQIFKSILIRHLYGEPQSKGFLLVLKKQTGSNNTFLEKFWFENIAMNLVL